jgi:hypothetical protein
MASDHRDVAVEQLEAGVHRRLERPELGSVAPDRRAAPAMSAAVDSVRP